VSDTSTDFGYSEYVAAQAKVSGPVWENYNKMRNDVRQPVEASAAPAAMEKQVGGEHYKNMPLQPAEFIHRNGIGFLEGNVIKYVCRHAAKNGEADIRKAIHYCELLLALKYGVK